MVNITYDALWVYNPGDIAWVLASTALVWLMIPGVGFFYSGLLRRKNALSMIWASMMTVAVVSFSVCSHSYARHTSGTNRVPSGPSGSSGLFVSFSDTADAYIGDLRYFGLKGVLETPSIGSTRIPSIAFCVFQLMFAAITPILAIGAIAERGRLGPIMVFVFVWSTIVYDPIACWTWNSHGWSFVLGGLDFAGGTPVHISSGTAALAISIYLGKRRGYGTDRLAYKPHNTTYVVIGTVFLWFGWFGFNGGSALSANLRAVQACIVTNLAASVGGLTWMLWITALSASGPLLVSALELSPDWSPSLPPQDMLGLVRAHPFSSPSTTDICVTAAAVLFGFMAGTLCNFATQLKFVFGYDDCLDIFASHAIGGVIGNVLTGLFAQASVAHFDGLTVIPGGWLDHHYIQLGYQIADSVAGMSYSFVMTTIILWIMHFIPGLRLRASEEAEIVGIDDAEMGEFAYDYVGIDIAASGGHDFHDDVHSHGDLPATTGGREPRHLHATKDGAGSIGDSEVSEKQPVAVA
ncbi:Ammonium transporter 1 [Grifola frondosa]|uniref:Ammonium transporter 1 n=1 Tax=Grifola frondosa TaxID=5627 RepID=A0A1C7MNJ5_GRIFR|nr:Ammonium transporter 1 [Grifola frondosa]